MKLRTIEYGFLEKLHTKKENIFTQVMYKLLNIQKP